MNLGYYSYLGAAIAYGIFAGLLLFSWRGSLQGKFLTATIIISAIWAGFATKIATDNRDWIWAYQIFEILRYMLWYVFLLKLFDAVAAKNIAYRKYVRWAMPMSVGFAGLVLLAEFFALSVLAVAGHVFLAIIGLALIEQLFRNTAVRQLWVIKYLFIGACGIFAFDFYMYVDAILFYGTDKDLWEARGIVNMVAVPMLAVSAVRNKNRSLKLFVSRDIIFTSTALMVGALYLLVMAGAGYYLREYGGDWGQIIRVIFFSLAVALLAALLFSGELRARLRVFIGKHFYKNKYDYRHEWLQLTDKLSAKGQDQETFDVVIQVLGSIVDARAGMLWLCDERKQYRNVASWNTERIDAIVSDDKLLVQFLDETGYIINLMELESHANEYHGLVLPSWIADIAEPPWLIVSLFGLEEMLGFVVLANPLFVRSINWEDRDLLKTAAKQVASYITVLKTSDELAQARQFEVFNRLSAYMVHDLKNISAELELVTRNAEKHKGNAEFLTDAFATVDNAAGDINRLLDQFRKKQVQHEKTCLIDLGSLVQAVIATKRGQSPEPHAEGLCELCYVVAEKGRLFNVLAHLIDNAQQATGKEGYVTITLTRKAAMHILEIRDTGHGMDADFIQNRLFKPFDTTKGNAGMGIGMYESREFIRHLGGEIVAQSEPGKGTLISLQIPESLEHTALGFKND